jgi:hypothetical protein
LAKQSALRLADKTQNHPETDESKTTIPPEKIIELGLRPHLVSAREIIKAKPIIKVEAAKGRIMVLTDSNGFSAARKPRIPVTVR